MPKPNLSADIVRELLDYDPKTGALTWRNRARKWFTDERQWKTWNTRFAGQVAGTLSKSVGYWKICIFHKIYGAHRLAWLHAHGKWPMPQIDHINGNRADNRLCNLREATPKINAQNTKQRADNKSGITGVNLYRDGRWRAYINHGNRIIHLGYFDDLLAAACARKSAERRHHYSANHGR